MNIPDKQEIKKAYNISEDDFEVLTSLPDESKVRKIGGMLERVASLFGGQTWMWKSRWGVILAIIFILPFAQDKIATVYNFWQPKAEFAYEKGIEIIRHISPPAPTEEVATIAVLPQNFVFNSPPDEVKFENLPIGTGVYALSASSEIFRA